MANLAWDISVVEVAGFSTFPSLAYSPVGQITVAYFSSINHALRYARRNTDKTWSVSTVAGELYGDCAPSLDYHFNQPAITYASNTYRAGDTSNPLKTMNYAVDHGPGDALNWSINTFAHESGPARVSSLAFDSSRKPVVSFSNKDGGLSWTRATPNETTWVGSAVDGKGNGAFNAIATAPTGQPAIAYSSAAASHDPARIKYAEYDGAHWTKQVIGEGNGWVTLAFTRYGDPAVVYARTNGTDSDVVFAARRQGKWTTEVVANNADSPSLAISVGNLIGVSYHARGPAAIMYAIDAGSGWSHFLVQESGKDTTGAMVGDFSATSIAYAANGQPTIAYYDRASGAIRVALGSQFATEPGRFRILDSLRGVFGRSVTR